MSRQKLRIHNTDTDNLISNLRGEVGEIISSWVLYRDIMVAAHRIGSHDPVIDMKNAALNRLLVLGDRLSDDIVARLSELAEKKIGRLNFYFASLKLQALDGEVNDFIGYIQRNRFEEKRNSDISHKELPERWSDHKYLRIEPMIILRGVVKSLRLMKRFDFLHLGPSSPYLWHQARKKRYELMTPPKAGYLLLPHLRLPDDIRVKIALEEIRLGISYWDDLPTQIDGQKVTLKGSKKWGIVKFGNRLLAIAEYPLIELKNISCRKPGERTDSKSDAEETNGSGKE